MKALLSLNKGEIFSTNMPQWCHSDRFNILVTVNGTII